MNDLDETDVEILRLIGDTRYRFCCPSCASRFKERYAELEEGA